jgi:hypothetical protein
MDDRRVADAAKAQLALKAAALERTLVADGAEDWPALCAFVAHARRLLMASGGGRVNVYPDNHLRVDLALHAGK